METLSKQFKYIITYTRKKLGKKLGRVRQKLKLIIKQEALKTLKNQYF